MGARNLNIGGQAVIEGVMMRSPGSFAVAVRRKSGEIVLREGAWRSLTERLTFLRRPFLRGGVVLAESLHNGLSALSFSASEAAKDEPSDERDGQAPQEMSKTAITLTMLFALGLALLFFLVLPHYLTLLLGKLTGLESLQDGQSAAFHAVDGTIKLIFFVLYVWAISHIPDIKRVFQYHGAEHKAIKAYEQGDPLTVESARKYSTLHPRCGTSFLLIVIMMAMLVFLAVFPWLPKISETGWIHQLALIAIKIPLMFPIAGLAYELQRLSARRAAHNPLVRALILPGILLQRITTAPPTDDQIEIALVAVRKVLDRESTGGLSDSVPPRVERFASYDEFIGGLGRI